MHMPKFQMLVTPNPLTDLAQIWYLEVFWGAFLNINSDLPFENFQKFRYKETYGTIT